MKAFTCYPKEQIYLRMLLRKMQDYGKINCDFETFTKLYEKWYIKMFPGCPVSAHTAIFRDDWLVSFINFLANCDI